VTSAAVAGSAAAAPSGHATATRFAAERPVAGGAVGSPSATFVDAAGLPPTLTIGSASNDALLPSQSVALI
jgi:hypothetical protein